MSKPASHLPREPEASRAADAGASPAVHASAADAGADVRAESGASPGADAATGAGLKAAAASAVERGGEPEMPPSAAVSPPEAPRPHDWLPWLCGLGFLLLLLAIGYVWQFPRVVVAPVGPGANQALAQRVDALSARVTQLAERPMSSGSGTDLGPLTSRVEALEQRRAPDLAGLTARVEALEKRQSPDLAPLAARVDALEKRQMPDLAPLAARVEALSSRVEALSGRTENADTEIGRRIAAVESGMSALRQALAHAEASTQQAARLARIDLATAALAAGRPLGQLPDAPASVARFANTAAPTEAVLRHDFEAVEAKALAAARPAETGQPFLSRVLARAEDLVTVRQGDHVLVGDPAAGVLARARSALVRGDLQAAVDATAALVGPAATAMAPWLAEARAVLEARAGLADMAAHA